MQLFFVISAAAAAFVPYASIHQTNPILQSLLGAQKKDIFSVDHFGQLKAQDLVRNGIVRIDGTKSLIINEALADAAMGNSQDIGAYFDNEKGFTHGDFVEISYENATIQSRESDWEPWGPVRKNLVSGPASFGQGWGIASTAHVYSTLALAQLLGTPQLSLDLTSAINFSGGMGCDALGYEQVQFAIKARYDTISNVSRRVVNIVKDWRGNYKLWHGEFEEMEPIVQMNEEGVEAACVTQSISET